MQFFYQFPQRVERLALVSSGGLGREVSPMLRTAALPGFSALLSATIRPRLIRALAGAGAGLRERRVGAGVYLQAIARAGTAASLLGSQIAFPVLALASGTLGGFEFAVASRMLPRPGTLYALDLMGSCLGAILFSVWLVPVFGFLKTALLSAMVSLAAAALAMLAHPPAGARRTPGR